MSDRPRQPNLPGLEDPADAPPAPPAKPATAPDVAPLTGQTVYAIDAHSLIYQVFHALPPMTGPTEQPVGATYGFARDIVFLLEQKRPDYLLCAFDLPGPTFRHERYEQYKVQREAMPEELRPQIADIRRLLEALNIPVIDYPAHEADDVLATIARQVERLGGNCFLVTSDKDCRQLLSERVRMYNVRKDALFDATDLEQDWGVRPEQVVDFQALVGDSVDNVPGVPLIGPKLARELLTRFGTLEAVLDGADQVSGAKRRENLINHRDDALLSRELVRLVDDLPVQVDWQAARVGDIHHDRVLELCREFGFGSLTERLGQLESKEAPKAWETNYRTVASQAELDRFVEQLSRQRRVALDTETTALNPRSAEIVGYSFSWGEGDGYYLPVRAPAGESHLDPQATLEALRPVLEDAGVEKVGQNLKYDMVVLRTAGVELAGVAFDTMVASYLLEAGQRNHSLDDLSKRFLNHTPVKISQLIGSGKQQRRMDEVPLEQIGPYAAEDADLAWRLADILRRRLDEQDLGRLFGELEIPLIDVLVELEFNGIRVDLDRLGELSAQYGQRMDALRQEIHELAGREFNIASPKQLAEVLFTQLGLPVIKKTKTGASTDAEVLEQLAKLHPLPEKIVAYRQYAKLKNTYVDAIPELVQPQTGRVHSSFNQVVAATGRLSSNEPNLQNIPVRTEEGREIRSAFLPGEDGWRLLAADYSQIELRVLAHFSEDEALCRAFANDDDIHARVASEVYGVALPDVSSAQRRAAKAINFGIIYGQSPFGLAKALDIEQDEAAEFIDAYFERYPGVDQFMLQVLTDCRRDGHVGTILGRRRAIQGIRAPEKFSATRQRTMPERTAINTVIQGSAADLIKLAMIAVYRRLASEPFQGRMLLQIHDELIFEAPAEQETSLAALVREEMTQVASLRVPLKVDIKSGVNWAQCEPIA